MQSREEAINLLNEWVKSESLRNHCRAVACAMEEYAEKFGENKEKWFLCGLLHDFDYERYPDINVHPFPGCEALERRGCDKEIIGAIKGHNYHHPTNIERKSRMAKTLFAVDELCGLLVALSKVRLNGFFDMAPSSVEKAMKKKDFAAAVSRDDIEKGIIELGIDRTEHFSTVIVALRSCRWQ